MPFSGPPMLATGTTPDREEAKQALERVLASRVFAKAERSRRFLRYLVESAVAQPPIAVKEYIIALDVFDRDKNYDPAIDATVRVEASRLRARLREYYLEEGGDDDLVIDVPKGSYAAVLHRRARIATASSANPVDISLDKPGQHDAPGSHHRNVLEIGTGVENAPRAKSVVRRKKVWRIAMVLAAICLVVAVVWNAGRWRGSFLGTPSTAGIETLAVLPLDNLSGHPGQEYFADGMTDELITMLAKNSTLRVVSRTSVMQYKGAHQPIRDIGRKLGADAILEGSVSRSGNQVHMTIQLIQAPTDTHLWAESYDRTANDAVSLSREASIAVAKRLDRAVPHLAADRYVSPEAHDAYLRGRYLWFTAENEKAGTYFKKATQLQPDYAPGWSGLSLYYSAGAVEGELEPRKALPAAEAAATKAVTLDDSFAEGHSAMSAAFFLNRWDWPRAEAEVNRAIELDPKFTDAYHLRAKMLAALNRHKEAIASQKMAMQIDPLERPWAMAMSLREARQFDAAIDDLRQWREGDTQGQMAQWVLCDIYRRKGALKDWEKACLTSGDKSAEGIRRAFQQGGYRAVLLWQMKGLKQSIGSRYVSPVDLALIYAQLGQREETLTLLEQGFREHSPLLLWIQNDPAYDFLHSDERYRAIIRGIGLPPAY
ncbi:MAG TPA: hypothetical protein VGD64_00435 [Acidisarcina sp.]